MANELIKRFEGLRLTPYLCLAGVPTIGYGSTYYEDGTPVTLHDPAITADRANALLEYTVNKIYAPAVAQLCPNADTKGRIEALIDFTYNLGAGQLRGSTLRKCIARGEWQRVPDELRKWNKGGGKVLKGLTLRREAESILIF